jgi:hypothetical protein
VAFLQMSLPRKVTLLARLADELVDQVGGTRPA